LSRDDLVIDLATRLLHILLVGPINAALGRGR